MPKREKVRYNIDKIDSEGAQINLIYRRAFESEKVIRLNIKKQFYNICLAGIGLFVLIKKKKK